MSDPLRKNFCVALALSVAVLVLPARESHGDSESGISLHVLGVAQDAGYPQAGCYRPHCLPGWEDRSRRRGATSIAVVDRTAGKKWLFEATPHLPEQLYELEQFAPSADFELDGVFLTHAHIGHYAGLMFFGHEAMGAQGIPVYAMPRMKSFLESNGPWSQLVSFGNIELSPLLGGKTVEFDSLRVTPMQVPHRDEFSETVGYRITGPNRSALFIPDIDQWQRWDQVLAAVIAGVDYALLDATFYDHGELPGRDMSQVPHPLVTDTMDRLQELPDAERRKVWFIHFNHTNPLLDRKSEAVKQVESRGFHVAYEGLKLPL